MKTRRVFMEIPEVVFEMTRQRNHLHAFVLNSSDASTDKARLTAKRNVLDAYLAILTKHVEDGTTANKAYEDVL